MTASIYSTPASSRAYLDAHMTSYEVEAYLKNRLKGASEEQVETLTNELLALCEKTGFTAADVLSLISTESSFRTEVVSNRGAIGLMQLQPTTAKFVARRENLEYHGAEDLKDPVINVTIGVHYLSYLRDRFGGTDYLAAYNMGPTKLARLLRNNEMKPGSVFRYVHDVQSGIHWIRHQAIKLAANAA